MNRPSEPAVFRLMKKIAHARDELAPQLPIYARRAPQPLADSEEHCGLYDSMRQVFNELHGAYVQEYGARSSWRQTASVDQAAALLREPYVEAVEEEPEGFSAVHTLEFDDAPLRAAGVAYRRECGWDFPPSAPSSDYVWLCVHEPLLCFPENDAIELQFTGSLIGFAIIADHDEDGTPDSLAHVWVARQARRQGNAALLLAEARRRFPQLKAVEKPVTADGLRLLRGRWPELAARLPGD